MSRLISSQKERDFSKTNYNDILRVFSIWVCTGMDESSMAYIHLAKDDLLGAGKWKGRLDLLNIVMIGVADALPEHDGQYEMHRLLSTVLSIELSADEKLRIMEQEYSIPMNDKIRKEVNDMYSLSQGIREKGRSEGRSEGRTEGLIEGEGNFILSMHKKGYTLEQIADVAEKSVTEIEAVIAKREPVLA